MDGRQDLRDLTIITEERNKEGYRQYRRLDTNQILFDDDVELLKEAPIIIAHLSNSELPKTMKMNHIDKVVEANALLIGTLYRKENGDYYPASYCRIRG